MNRTPIAADAFTSALRGVPGICVHRTFGAPHRQFFAATLTVEGENLIPSFGALLWVRVDSPVELTIPHAWPQEGWLRREIDWHVYSDGHLCLDLQTRWRDFVGAVQRDRGAAIAATYAAEYFTHSARWLLTRHRYGWLNHLERWSWPQWSHGRRGLREYLSERYAA
jgi:hypothetical protein